MELDSLKEIWKGAEHQHKESDAQILSMLKQKSQSPIDKMKRNLFFELVAILVLYTGMIVYYFVAYKGLYWELSVLLLVVGVLFLIYYYYKNKLLREMECVACEVKHNLERQVTTLEKYVRLYFLAGTIATPLAYFLAGFIVFYKSEGMKSSPKFWFIFLITGVVMTILLYFVNKWYVKKLYGQHIDKLKHLLRQMED